MSGEIYCVYCEDYNHETIWCPKLQIRCSKCFEKGHNKRTCTVGWEEFPLPEEIVLKIFGYLGSLELGNCAQVSKRWRRITVDRELHCNEGKVFESPKKIFFILVHDFSKRQGFYIKNLKIRKTTKNEFRIYEFFLQRGCQI